MSKAILNRVTFNKIIYSKPALLTEFVNVIHIYEEKSFESKRNTTTGLEELDVDFFFLI